MAPALVETLPNTNAEVTYEKDKKQANYKEAFAQSAASTKYETEINGSDTIEPAKYPHYLPCKSLHPMKVVYID